MALVGRSKRSFFEEDPSKKQVPLAIVTGAVFAVKGRKRGLERQRRKE